MSTLIDLAEYLEAEGFGPVALAGLPSEGDQAIGLAEYAGGAPGFVHNKREPNDSNVRVQLQVRDADYPAAKSTADMAWRALSRIVNTPLNGTLYLRVTPLQEPAPLDVADDQRRHLMVCNFSVLKEA